MRQVTLGVVPYLNALPLIEGLEEVSWIRIVRALPSRLTEMMARGEIDAATLPIIDAACDEEYVVIPGIAIRSHGPAGSVRLFHRGDLREVAAIHLDPASRTSSVLLRILMEIHLGLHPAYLGSAGEAGEAEAFLRIGDESLFADDGRYESMDLGEVWTRWTGLPFVYAAWVARGDHALLQEALTEAKRRGQEAIGRISRQAAERTGRDAGRIETYLQQMMGYDLGGEEREAIDLYFRYASEVGALPPRTTLRFAAGEGGQADRGR